MGKKLNFLILTLFLALCLFGFACSPDDEEEPGKPDDSMTIEIETIHDDLFGFEDARRVAYAEFSDSRGEIGTPVDVLIKMEDIERFSGNDIEVDIELLNPDLTKDDSFYASEIFNDDRFEFRWFVPQVYTIPSLLNFYIYLRVGDPESGDYFEARGFLQYYVNQGQPAT